MAKVRAPLLSFSATGSIANTQVYATWKGRTYVRQKVIPANPNTASQQLTRNTFKFLNGLWKYLPAAAKAAWQLYGDNSRFTATNGFIKLNNGPLRSETDLEAMTMSPSAGSGLIAASVTATAGDDQITVDLVPPTLPTGWAVTEAHAMAIRNVDPQTSTVYDVTAASDSSDPYSIVLTGLETATEYLVGGWFKFTKPDGSFAYGASLQTTATTT